MDTKDINLLELLRSAPLCSYAQCLTLVQAIACGLLASTLAIGYSEILFSGTSALYKAGKLKRYYPLPAERGIVTAWLNTLSFTLPTALYVFLFQRHLARSWAFNPLHLLLSTLAYMLLHDIYFYLVHRTFHTSRPLYAYFHAMHHEHAYAMNVFAVGYAELAENFVQVGVPWVVWTMLAGGNWWYWMAPLSLVLFTTLVGHSGYRMSPWIMAFHPLVLPVVALTGRLMLTPGDHQVQYNFGLFWRVMDRMGGTYRKCEVRAHDVTFWKAWAENKESSSEQAKKWMGKHPVSFHEVEWGF